MNLDPAVLRNIFSGMGLTAAVVSGLSQKDVTVKVRTKMELAKQVLEYQGRNPRPIPICEKYITGVVRGEELSRACIVCGGRRGYCGNGSRIPIYLSTREQ